MPFGFTAIAYAWLLAMLIPLVVFYFLKLKRMRLEIPSLVLWQQVINDRRVNSPFQRFKRNILLWLQILALLLIVLAAMQPYWRRAPGSADRVPILIDRSASMAALDRPGGVSRLEHVRKQVRERIDGLPSGQQLCIISFGRTARKETGFTDNKRILREALDGIHVADVASDLEDALRIAQAMAQNEPFDEVLLFSDGNFPATSSFELPFALNFQRLPAAGANVGITALNARRAPDRQWDVFAQVESSSSDSQPATVRLLVDGEEISRHDVSVDAEASERLMFRIAGDEASAVQVALAPGGFDSLATDNVAYLDLPPIRSLVVHVPPHLVSFRKALAGVGGVRIVPEEGGGEPAAGDYDVVITDDAEGVAAETPVALGVGFVPEDIADLVETDDDGTSVVDWMRNAPLLQHVELGDLSMLDRPGYLAQANEGALNERGYTVLAHGTDGPLILEKTEPGRRREYLLFHADRSTLPYRIGFPILLYNLAAIAMTEAGLSETRAARTGVLPPLSVRPETACQVTGPDGAVRSAVSSVDGVLDGVSADRVGMYEVAVDGSVRHRFGVGLLSPGESSVVGVDLIQFNELTVAAAAVPAKADRSLWPMLALLGFVVLLLEWWVFQYRPVVGGTSRP